MYVGTIALRILCEQSGWNYQRWRGIDKVDFDSIYLRSLEMFGTDEERDAMQKACQRQAEEILAQHWKAIVRCSASVRSRNLPRRRGNGDHDTLYLCGYPVETPEYRNVSIDSGNFSLILPLFYTGVQKRCE